METGGEQSMSPVAKKYAMFLCVHASVCIASGVRVVWAIAFTCIGCAPLKLFQLNELNGYLPALCFAASVPHNSIILPRICSTRLRSCFAPPKFVYGHDDDDDDSNFAMHPCNYVIIEIAFNKCRSTAHQHYPRCRQRIRFMCDSIMSICAKWEWPIGEWRRRAGDFQSLKRSFCRNHLIGPVGMGTDALSLTLTGKYVERSMHAAGNRPSHWNRF